MKKTIITMLAALAFTSASGAYAQSAVHTQSPAMNLCSFAAIFGFACASPGVQHDRERDHPRAVPEINARSGTQALALLFGALLLGAEGYRRRS